MQILQVLYSFACTAEGAILLLGSKNWTSIVNFAPRGGLTPDIVKHTYLAIGVSDLSTLPGFKDGISAWLDRDLSILVMECKDHATTELVFGLLNELLDKLPHEVSIFPISFRPNSNIELVLPNLPNMACRTHKENA